jgi:DNA processing protein
VYNNVLAASIVSEFGVIDGLHFVQDVLDGKKTIDQKLHQRLKCFREPLDLLDLDKCEEGMGRFGITFLTPEDVAWPKRVSDLLETRPVGLFVRGETDLEKVFNKSVAIVGSRNATDYGRKITANLSAELSDLGWSIVSGGAIGIDIVAHSNAKSSPTVAFLAGGVENLTPSSNERQMMKMIDTGGAVVSEYPIGTPVAGFRFLDRNRLIAACSCASIVVEANFRSGALSTIRHALDLNRPVGAFPGSVFSATSSGCHDIIKNNYVSLVTSTRDVVELAEAKLQVDDKVQTEFGPKGENDVLRILKESNAVSVKSLQEKLQLAEDDISRLLLTLQLKGELIAGKRSGTWVAAKH